MSRASELEAARLAAERLDARCNALCVLVDNAGQPRDLAGEILTNVASQLLAEATYISERRKSGWKSRSDAHTAAGRILEQWAKDLAAYLERDEPPARPPLETIPPPTRHADLDPADGPISAQITSGLLAAATPAPDWPDGPITPDAATRVRLAIEAGADTDAKLDAAFGPVAEPTGDLTVHITAAPANYAWCDATTGLRGYVGSATCPDCITRWDAHHGTVYGRESDRRVPTPDTPTIDGPPDAITFGPGESWSMQWNAQGIVSFDDGSVAQVPIPQFSEPAARRVSDFGPWITAMYDGECSTCDGAFLAGDDIRADGDGTWQGRCCDYGSDVPPPGAQAYVVTNLDQVPQFSEPGPAPARQMQQRMTFEAVRQHGMARARGADHRSYSQVQAFSECGVRYALSDLDVTPAWWNVGGTALHYACEWINREAYGAQSATADPGTTLPDANGHVVETLWTNCLNRSVSETITENPTVGPDRWRAAKKGSEGYDWWRINGVDMVRRWIVRLAWLYEQGWTIATFDGKPAIELDCPMWINSVKVENILDLVMTRADGALLIIDMKSGTSAPDSTAQLGQYSHALDRHLGDGTAGRIRELYGAYWLARTDMLSPVDVTKSDTATDLRELHPWSEIEYLITTMHTAESQGLYLPNKSKSDRFGCGSCGVAGLCPVGPR